MKVLKFGESTLKDKESFRRIIEKVSSEYESCPALFIVVSSVYGVAGKLTQMSELAVRGDNSYLGLLKEIEKTHFDIAKSFTDIRRQSKVIANLKVSLNELEELLNGIYIIGEVSSRIMDYVYSFGVRMSAYLLQECLKETLPDTNHPDIRNYLLTDSKFAEAGIDMVNTTSILKKEFKEKKGIWVVSGMIGSDKNNDTTTFRKLGSSYTAALLAGILDAEQLDIYTDINGISNFDADLAEGSKSLEELSYTEAMEMSNFGTQVIYPPSIQPAMDAALTIVLRNLYNPDFAGTHIVSKANRQSQSAIKVISTITEVAMLTIQGSGLVGMVGFAARVFNTLARSGISVIFITQASSEHSISLGLLEKDGPQAKKALEEEFVSELAVKNVSEIDLEGNLTILAVIGDNMKHTPGIAGKVFSVLGDSQINISAIAQGSSERNISLVIASKEVKKAIMALKATFL